MYLSPVLCLVQKGGWTETLPITWWWVGGAKLMFKIAKFDLFCVKWALYKHGDLWLYLVSDTNRTYFKPRLAACAVWLMWQERRSHLVVPSGETRHRRSIIWGLGPRAAAVCSAFFGWEPAEQVGGELGSEASFVLLMFFSPACCVVSLRRTRQPQESFLPRNFRQNTERWGRVWVMGLALIQREKNTHSRFLSQVSTGLMDVGLFCM